MRWTDKRYHTLNYELKKEFGQKAIKLSIDGGFSCPNRDGTLGTRGCLFCGEKGAGEFAGSREVSISGQIAQQKELMSRKWANAKYIAYLGTYLWVELGLQTIHQRSADLIRRGYDLGCFLKAVQELRAGKIRVVTHLIMGLPGESPEEDMLETVRYVAELGIWGVKIQLLHVQRRIDNDDKYRFIIQANKAKGSYEFKWNIE